MIVINFEHWPAYVTKGHFYSRIYWWGYTWTPFVYRIKRPDDSEQLTYSCHACGAINFDRRTAIMAVDISSQYALDAGIAFRHIHYCRGQEHCYKESLRLKKHYVKQN